MFDVAPTELLVVAVVALLVIGPKDLPKAMRFVGKWVGKARAMSRHFRSGLDTMMREAEMEEMEAQWRKHNEEIMRNYPSTTPHQTALPAPGAIEPVTHVASAAPQPAVAPAPASDAAPSAQNELPLGEKS